jgi:hypothetical protein
MARTMPIKPCWIAILVLAIGQAPPAHAQSFPNYLWLDCTARATDTLGRAEPYQATFYVSLATRRFCVETCTMVFALPRWDADSIDLSRQWPPTPPTPPAESDPVWLNGFGMRETFNVRTGAFSGTEVTNGSSHRRRSVRGRCNMRPLNAFPIRNFLDSMSPDLVVPAPSAADPI